MLCDGDVIEADMLRASEAAPVAAPSVAPGATAQPSTAPSPLAVRKASEHKVVDALEEANWNKVRAAQVLGMPRRTLYRRLQEYGLLDQLRRHPDPRGRV